MKHERIDKDSYGIISFNILLNVDIEQQEEQEQLIDFGFCFLLENWGIEYFKVFVWRKLIWNIVGRSVWDAAHYELIMKAKYNYWLTHIQADYFLVLLWLNQIKLAILDS